MPQLRSSLITLLVGAAAGLRLPPGSGTVSRCHLGPGRGRGDRQGTDGCRQAPGPRRSTQPWICIPRRSIT